jgi:hypothetical protein
MITRLILPLILCLTLLIMFGRAEANDYLCSEDGVTFAITDGVLHYQGLETPGVFKETWAGMIWASKYLAIVIDHRGDYIMVLLNDEIIGRGTCIEGGTQL